MSTALQSISRTSPFKAFKNTLVFEPYVIGLLQITEGPDTLSLITIFSKYGEAFVVLSLSMLNMPNFYLVFIIFGVFTVLFKHRKLFTDPGSPELPLNRIFLT